MPFSIHIITDSVLQKKFSHAELARLAWEGGADVVQFREKKFNAYYRIMVAKEMVALPRTKKQKLIINDEPEVSLMAGANGVHLGQEDMDCLKARVVLGDESLIGATVHNEKELLALKGKPIDYIGVGPVFETKTKNSGLPVLGLKGLESLCKISSWPVIAIGSVNLSNVKDVRSAGALGVAVVSAFCLSENPADVVRRFREILG